MSSLAKGKGKRALPDDKSSNKYSKPSKKVKPDLSTEEKLEKKYRSLRDQVQDGYLQNALKTSKRILELSSNSEASQHSHIQILLSLDKYKEALQFIESQDPNSSSGRSNSDGVEGQSWMLERSYALYKLGRVPEAAKLLAAIREESTQVEDDPAFARSVDVLDAQIKYRLEQFQQAQELFDELLATAEADTPEYADLSTNLTACNDHLDFFKSIPSRIAEMSGPHAERRLPSIEELETTPILPLISAHPAFKARTTKNQLASTSTSTAQAASSSKSKSGTPKKVGKDGKEKKKRSSKLPAAVAALSEGQRPAPDPERWLPKRERKGYAEILAAKEREKEKKRMKARKKLEATMTQGAASGPDEGANKQAQQQGGGGGGASKSKNKKKKGGK